VDAGAEEVGVGGGVVFSFLSDFLIEAAADGILCENDCSEVESEDDNDDNEVDNDDCPEEAAGTPSLL